MNGHVSQAVLSCNSVAGVLKKNRSPLARTVFADTLLRDGLVLTAATALMNLTNWLYHMVMSRMLGPVDYGGLGALLGLLFVLTVPVSAVQMDLSAFVAPARAPRANHPPTLRCSVSARRTKSIELILEGRQQDGLEQCESARDRRGRIHRRALGRPAAQHEGNCDDR
jgi:hypothetical protein